MSEHLHKLRSVMFAVVVALMVAITGFINLSGYTDDSGESLIGTSSLPDIKSELNLTPEMIIINDPNTRPVAGEPTAGGTDKTDRLEAAGEPELPSISIAETDTAGDDDAHEPETVKESKLSPSPDESSSPSSSNQEQPPPDPQEPVAYVWGSSHRVGFKSEVHVTNTGNETAENIWVDLPMLENSSPYQVTELTSTNYDLAYSTGRLGSFGIGDLEPGETKIIITEYTITIRPVSIESTNDTVEKAKQAYQQHAGSGNCLTLATRFVSRCRELGVTARLVYGFARPERTAITPGPLTGNRHSWAEFFVEGLGWVPVDLTFQYFGKLPHASHVIEAYAEQSVKVYHLGGSVNVSWHNSIF